jgi:Family of unknown function (DUF6502)
MNDRVKSAVSAATLRLLNPLARFLLEARIGVGELYALSKLAYVAVAAERAKAGGGPQRPNVARIAAETGLTRVDVAALLAELAGQEAPARRGRVRAERVLSGWWDDPAFQDHTGAPALLKLKGARQSFATLVKRHSGDRHTAPILDELLRSKAVRQLADGRLEAVSRTCVSVAWDPEGIEALGKELTEHLDTLLYNLRNPENPRFARRVTCARLDAHAARVVIPELTEQAEIFLEGAADALNHSNNRSTPDRPGSAALKFAVAVQFFQEPTIESSEESRTRIARGPQSRTLRRKDSSRSKALKIRREVGAL